MLQSLPIALMRSRLHIGALYFLQSCINNGGYFSPSVIDDVIREISAFRHECAIQEDTQASDVISQILYNLYDIILTDKEYQKTPEIYLSI